MNRQSSVEGTGGERETVESRAGRRGDLRKTSRSPPAKPPTTSKRSGGAAAVSGDQERVGDEDADDKDVKTGESTIQRKRARVRLRDVEGEWERKSRTDLNDQRQVASHFFVEPMTFPSFGLR